MFENPSATRKVCFIRGAGDSVDHDWPDNRVRHALELAAALRTRWDRKLADELVERFGLLPAARLSALSRGQRSALGVVLGLASRAPLTIFDESYLGMDAPSRSAFYDVLLADFIAHPRTIVLSTHLIQEVTPLLEQVTIIDAGRVLLQAPAEDLRARGTAVVGPAQTVEHVWMTAGALGGVAFYRRPVGGLLSVPVVMGMVVVIEGATRSDILRIAARWGWEGTLATATGAVALAAVTVAAGLALSWPLARDLPLRPQNT